MVAFLLDNIFVGGSLSRMINCPINDKLLFRTGYCTKYVLGSAILRLTLANPSYHNQKNMKHYKKYQKIDKNIKNTEKEYQKH